MGTRHRFMNMENTFILGAYNNLCLTLLGMISDKMLSRIQWSLMHAPDSVDVLNSPSAVTPGSTTNTVVLAIILLSSSSEPEDPCWVARDRPDSESGSVTQRDSPHSSRSQRRMSHWTWTVLESGNRNIEYSFDVEIPRLESNTNWDRTFLSGHLRRGNNYQDWRGGGREVSLPFTV